MIGTSASDIAAQARQRAKDAELQRRAKAMGWKTVSEYKNSGWAQNKSAFKANESKVQTSKLTEEKKNSIPMKNTTIDKFSEKVYPIWQATGKPYTDTKGSTHTPIITSGMYGTKAQRDSSRAVVTGTNLVNTAAGPLFKEPTKKTPLVKPGNTRAGALVKRTTAQQKEQLRINNQR